jgi:hypothetical protein
VLSESRTVVGPPPVGSSADGNGGSKRYQTTEDAQRYAAGPDRDDRERLGRRAPVGLTPLRLLNRALRRRG